jgi:hypothetical protein
MQVIDANGNMFGYNSITVSGPDGKPKLFPFTSNSVLITSSPYTPTSSDYYIYVDMLTPCVINLPAIASANPSGYNIKNIGKSTVKIVPLISEPIDDQAEINIKNAYTSLDIVHTATNWYIV